MHLERSRQRFDLLATIRIVLADRYELVRVLGKGGMGVVHEAVSRGAQGFARRVVVKQLLIEADAGDLLAVVQRFLDEARIASRLHHAGIVSILDCGVDEGLPFLVLELVDGPDLGAVLRLAEERRTRMPVDVALHIAADMAHALAYAHEARDERGAPLGIVHRDVKPSNVLLSRAGDVKLGDFGIAIAFERSAKTTGNITQGTPAFMAPEQWLGAVDARADIFSLGCTLHAMLTGRSPLAGHGASAVLESGEIVLPPGLPDDVRAIVARAIRKRADERYPTARAMAAALGEALAGRLRTDPKSALLEWLGSLEAGEAPAGATLVEAPSDLAVEPPPREPGAREPGDVRTTARPATSSRTRREPRAKPSVARRFLFATALTLFAGALVTGGAFGALAWNRAMQLRAVAKDAGADAEGLTTVAATEAATVPPTAGAAVTGDPAAGRADSPAAGVASPAAAVEAKPRADRKSSSKTPAPAATAQDRCRCAFPTKDGHSYFCTKLHPPVCACWAQGSRGPHQIVCQEPWQEGRCLHGYHRPGKAEDPCEGHTPDNKEHIRGRLLCSSCDTTPFRAVPGASCSGVTEAGLVSQGTIRCE